MFLIIISMSLFCQSWVFLAETNQTALVHVVTTQWFRGELYLTDYSPFGTVLSASYIKRYVSTLILQKTCLKMICMQDLLTFTRKFYLFVPTVQSLTISIKWWILQASQAYLVSIWPTSLLLLQTPTESKRSSHSIMVFLHKKFPYLESIFIFILINISFPFSAGGSWAQITVSNMTGCTSPTCHLNLVMEATATTVSGVAPVLTKQTAIGRIIGTGKADKDPLHASTH